MIINTRNPYKWHRIFALWPRRVAPFKLAWLQMIERRRNVFKLFYPYEYRLIGGEQ